MESQLPAGTVTFLFTDIEGSTQLMRELGDGYGEVLDEHRRILREHFVGAGGREIDTQGDAFFFSFTRAREAVRGAVAAQRALGDHEWTNGADVRVRMGLHTGEPAIGSEGYHGVDVVRAARICAAGRGGEILISETTRALIGNDPPDGVQIVDVGAQELKGLEEERLFQVSLADRDDSGLPAVKPQRSPHRSHAELLGEDFSRRIDGFVQQELERSFAVARERRPVPPPPERKESTVVILGVIFGVTGGVIALAIVALLVLKFAF